MPKLLPQITATDKFIQRVSKGRVTILDIAGLPNLMLTVKGRKSGVPRTTPLLCVPYESGNLIAGSNFGGEKKPVWVVNVRAATEKGERVGVRADGVSTRPAVREVTGAERDRALGAHDQDLAQLREVRRAHRPHHPGVLPRPGPDRSTSQGPALPRVATREVRFTVPVKPSARHPHQQPPVHAPGAHLLARGDQVAVELAGRVDCWRVRRPRGRSSG